MFTISPSGISIGDLVSQGTPGSVIYIDSNGLVAQDNSNLFWDATNHRLGIGVNSSLVAKSNISTGGTTEVGEIIQLIANQSGDAFQILNSAAIKRSSFDSSGMLAFWNGQTETVSVTLQAVTLAGTFTFNNVNSTIQGFVNSMNITYTAAPIFGIMPFLFYNKPTIILSNDSVTYSGMGTFYNAITYTADTGKNVGYAGSLSPFSDAAAFNVNSTGLWKNTNAYISFVSGPSFSGAGTTWGTRTAFKVNDVALASSATLVTNIGLDIATLTAATTNIAIRTGVGGVIQIGNLITKYNNIATVSGGVPSELATVDLTAQTAAIAATTIYTPAATGMFRISAYLQVTTAGTTSILGGATGVVITYNDGDGNVAQSDTMGLFSPTGTVVTTLNTNTTATNLEGTMVIYARTGVAIKYAIGYTSAGTAMQFAAHLKVEAL